MPCFPKSLTGAMPTWEALPLLLSKPDAYMLPANFGGHLSKSSREPTLGSCSGQPPYPRAAGENRGSREVPTWSRSPVLGRTPSAGRPCSGPAVPAANPPCAAPSPQHCTDPGTQHTLPLTKGGHNPFRPNAGPLGDESCEEKSPLAYSGSCFPPPPYPAPQGGHCPTASGAHHQCQLLAPLRGSEGDGGEGGRRLNYCNNNMFFNLYPLRWPGFNVLSPPSSGNGPNFPSLLQHGCESATTPIPSSAPLAGLRRGFHTWRHVFVLFFFICYIFLHYFIDLIKGISSSYRIPHCHSGLVAFQSLSILIFFKPVGLWKVQMDDLKDYNCHVWPYALLQLLQAVI